MHSIYNLQSISNWVKEVWPLKTSFCSENGHITPQEKMCPCWLTFLRSTLKPCIESQEPGFEIMDKWNSYWQPMTVDIKATPWQQDVVTLIWIKKFIQMFLYEIGFAKIVYVQKLTNLQYKSPNIANYSDIDWLIPGWTNICNC